MGMVYAVWKRKGQNKFIRLYFENSLRTFPEVLLMLPLGKQADFCPDKTTKPALIYDLRGQSKSLENTHPLKTSSLAGCHSHTSFFFSIGWLDIPDMKSLFSKQSFHMLYYMRRKS